MNDFLYVKVLLYAYPKLEALAEAVSDSAEVKALLSYRRFSAEEAAEKIAEEIFLARRLRETREVLDGALSAFGEEELFLLEYKYFRRRNVLKERFAGMSFAGSERNYFRRQNALLRKVASALAVRGLTERAFFERFGTYAPFRRVLRAIREGRELSVVWKRRRREIAFQNSGSSCGVGDFLPRKTNTAIATSAAAIAQITAICTPESEPAGGSGSAGAPPETSSR